MQALPWLVLFVLIMPAVIIISDYGNIKKKEL